MVNIWMAYACCYAQFDCKALRVLMTDLLIYMAYFCVACGVEPAVIMRDMPYFMPLCVDYLLNMVFSGPRRRLLPWLSWIYLARSPNAQKQLVLPQRNHVAQRTQPIELMTSVGVGNLLSLAPAFTKFPRQSLHSKLAAGC
jgi:hypothetical protein